MLENVSIIPESMYGQYINGRHALPPFDGKPQNIGRFNPAKNTPRYRVLPKDMLNLASISGVPIASRNGVDVYQGKLNRESYVPRHVRQALNKPNPSNSVS